MRVLVTGASGFVGAAVCEQLLSRGHFVRRGLRSVDRSVRPRCSGVDSPVEDHEIGEIGPATSWGPVLSGIDVVVHLAARVHMLAERPGEAAPDYWQVNVMGTRHLAEQAAAAGVKRLIFISSVKVHGEESSRPLRETDPPWPTDRYGESKWEAEQALWEATSRSRLEGVVLRPPLVYGPRVKANFLRLVQAVDRRIPLPFGAIRNRRSLVYVGNLADAVIASAEAGPAAGETFLVGDERAVSTPELVREIAVALGTAPRLLPVPRSWLIGAARLAGRRTAMQRLCGSLEVDTRRIRSVLGWSPPFTLQQGLAETARWFITERNGRER